MLGSNRVGREKGGEQSRISGQGDELIPLGSYLGWKCKTEDAFQKEQKEIHSTVERTDGFDEVCFQKSISEDVRLR